MRKIKFIGKALLMTVFCFFWTGSMLWAQNIITITDSQPYFENFESGSLGLWTVDATDGGQWSVLTGSLSTVASFSGQNEGDEARLISPILDISSVSEAKLTFSYVMFGVFTQDELEVCYRSSETDTWHILGTLSVSDYSNYYEQTYILPNLSASYQISFNGRYQGGIYLFVSNIEVASTASCIRPTNLAAEDITMSSALLRWDTSGNESSWIIELNDQETVVYTQPYLMEGLTPQTDYSFRVKASCGENDESEWSTPIFFTTLCDVYVVTDENPYFDDFEASSDFICWQTEIISGIDNWTVDPGYLIVNNTAFFIWLGGEARLISVPLDITSVTNPALSFKHKQQEYSSIVDELSVWYRTSPEDGWHFLSSYLYPAEDWETETLTLPNPSSTYQISFVGTGHNAGGVYVDDVKVGKKPNVGIYETDGLSASVYPNPTSNKVKITADVMEGEVSVYDMFGKHIVSTTIQDGCAEIDLSNCANGVYIAHLTSVNGIATIKLVKE